VKPAQQEGFVSKCAKKIFQKIVKRVFTKRLLHPKGIGLPRSSHICHAAHKLLISNMAQGLAVDTYNPFLHEDDKKSVQFRCL